MNKGKLVFKAEDQEGEEKIKNIQKQKKIKKPQRLQFIQREKSQSLLLNVDEDSFQNNKVEVESQFEKLQRKQEKISHLAVCFPDSILQIPQTSTIRAYFISEIARISSIFKADEIVILRDHSYTPKSEKFVPYEYIARNLQYLQTPQYLRKHLFKKHPDLGNVGLMNPIQARHHLKSDELCQYREGVTLERPTKKGAGSWVDIGLKRQAKMDHLLLPNTRVTLKITNHQEEDTPFYQAQAVSKKTPRIQRGLYWGYDVRIANNLKEMCKKGTYDYILLCNHSSESYNLPQIESFTTLDLHEKSILIFFVGTDDLSNFIEKDENSKMTLEKSLQLFNYSIKLSGFGVKGLRLEEQLFICLSKLNQFTL